MSGESAFFYGTLMHPAILKRVIGKDGSHLQICPAVLLKFTRHCVKDADYPGIIPYDEGRRAGFFPRDLDREACSVRGTMVTGLSDDDMKYLDTFEGSEYDRTVVGVHPLGDLVGLSDYTMPTGTPPPLPSKLDPPVEVETYVYGNKENKPGVNLMQDIWDFDDFVKKNAWKWYGNASRDNPDFTEVDRRQAEGAK
ncbi:hypothetical protein DFH07DRAFT_820686 [Mycena maculata]|uniref:Putative gamma-glutamylcyclotransferase n=1 Tax=Mycena maculata TaxID=230809 RepID=A0AAD7J594_9AGAR|nr:hypothetical protein DFH07DRAFT_820686 [Mycena maculata]